MKAKASIIATAATISLFSTALGDVVIDITGSTAGRTGVINQITAILGTAPYTSVGAAYVLESGVTSTANANYSIFKATWDGDGAGGPNPPVDVYVRTAWEGSASGVQNVSDAPQLNNKYIATTATLGTFPAGTTTTAREAASAQTVSEIGFSDVFQTSTQFQNNTFEEEVSVGIIPFKFFRNDGATAPTNMTSIAARALYTGNGTMKLSLFTGLAADAGTNVYAIGRDSLSGTRITKLAEMGIGVFKPISQLTGTVASDEVTLTTLADPNLGGFSSGSGVRGLLAAKNAVADTGFPAGPIVGYLGASDWSGAAGGGAIELPYNGVTYSEEALRNGSYTFWGYLHQFRMDLSAADPDGITDGFYEALKTGMLANPGTSVGLVVETTMNVKRSADGAKVFPK